MKVKEHEGMDKRAQGHVGETSSMYNMAQGVQEGGQLKAMSS